MNKALFAAHRRTLQALSMAFLAVVALSTDVEAAAAKKKSFLRVDPPLVVAVAEYSDGEQPASLERWRGKPVLLNVWATWCPPCVKELPALDRLAGQFAGEVHVLALSTDDGGAAQVKPFFEKLAVTRMIALYDVKQRAFQDFSLRGLPTTLLLDAEGRLVARMEGAADWDSAAMRKEIRRLVGLPAGK